MRTTLFHSVNPGLSHAPASSYPRPTASPQARHRVPSGLRSAPRSQAEGDRAGPFDEERGTTCRGRSVSRLPLTAQGRTPRYEAFQQGPFRGHRVEPVDSKKASARRRRRRRRKNTKATRGSGNPIANMTKLGGSGTLLSPSVALTPMVSSMLSNRAGGRPSTSTPHSRR
jgi:hypothetical protein